MATVGDLLGDASLRLQPVAVSRPEVQIRWIATSELPDPTPFLQGSEVLLTTGIQTNDWVREWVPYVEALQRSGTAGIGFGTGLSHRGIPSGLIEACRGAGVNLFEVPRSTPFVAVTQRLSRLLAEEEQASARESMLVARRLTAAAAKPAGMRAVLPVLAQALGGAAAALSGDGDVLIAPVGPRRAELHPDRLRADVAALRRHVSRAATTLSDVDGTIILQPFGVSARRSSTLVALGPARISDAHRSAVTTAVALLALIAEQEHHAAETHRRLRDRAVRLLVSGAVEVADVLLGVDDPGMRVPATVRVLRAGGPGEALTDAAALIEHRAVLVAHTEDQLWIVASESRARTVAATLVEAGAWVGVGSRVPAAQSPDSHHRAGLALAQATAAAPLVAWDDVLHDGPLGLMDPAAAAQFAQSMLGGLDAEQIATLRCFLQHHGSHLKVAETLRLHRNTVRKRLVVIASQLPGSLDDPQVRASAWIALQAMSGTPALDDARLSDRTPP